MKLWNAIKNNELGALNIHKNLLWRTWFLHISWSTTTRPGLYPNWHACELYEGGQVKQHNTTANKGIYAHIQTFRVLCCLHPHLSQMSPCLNNAKGLTNINLHEDGILEEVMSQNPQLVFATPWQAPRRYPETLFQVLLELVPQPAQQLHAQQVQLQQVRLQIHNRVGSSH